MKRILILAVVAALAVSTVSSFATMYSFQPSPKDLNDLTHQEAYRWGINWSVPAGQHIVSASLLFDDIYDWEHESNVLYVNLLDTAQAGVKVYTDNENPTNYFQGWGQPLVTYYNISTTPHDITYHFTSAQIGYLSTYSADGNFGLGIDPDCHFYNCGVKLCVETVHNCPPPTGIPEPSTLLLILGGLVTAGGSRFLLRRRK